MIDQNNLQNEKKNNIQYDQNFFSQKNIFGFWIYLMSDCILFATMFAVYCVMSQSIFFDNHFFNLKLIFCETIILLLSSIFYGIVILSAEYKKIFFLYFFLLLTFLFGTSFISLESYEFYNLIKLGYTPQKNGFLSSLFTLLGLHGLHVVIGLIWILSIFFQLLKLNLNKVIYVRILCLGLFWHFLDIIWICVFTLIYLMGSIL